MDTRSSFNLDLEVPRVDGKTSFSKKPKNFFSKGCKGSNSVTLLRTKRIMKKLDPGFEATKHWKTFHNPRGDRVIKKIN